MARATCRRGRLGVRGGRAFVLCVGGVVFVGGAWASDVVVCVRKIVKPVRPFAGLQTPLNARGVV